MVEAKCIEVDNATPKLAPNHPGCSPKLNNEQWQALIALHRTLLLEHYDFLLASQHPSVSPALRRLASKYAMPARMWRHGVHSFLEMMRARLPDSLDHMVTFINLSYSMVTAMYQQFLSFEDSWTEYLGDLARYKMAIEYDDIRKRESWGDVAHYWYSKASNKSLTTGKLYHQHGFLGKTNLLRQLFYFSKSLYVTALSTLAREPMFALFETVFAPEAQTQRSSPPLEFAFVQAHGTLFNQERAETSETVLREFLCLLNHPKTTVSRSSNHAEQGYLFAIINCNGLLGSASEYNPLLMATQPKDHGINAEITDGLAYRDSESLGSFQNPKRLSISTLKIMLEKSLVEGVEPDTLAYIHVKLVFMAFLSRHDTAVALVKDEFPWDLFANVLNMMLWAADTVDNISDQTLPSPRNANGAICPLPEDYFMRGLLWAEDNVHNDWFEDEICEADKWLEDTWMANKRIERILWLAVHLSQSSSSDLIYNPAELDLGEYVDSVPGFFTQSQIDSLTSQYPTAPAASDGQEAQSEFSFSLSNLSTQDTRPSAVGSLEDHSKNAMNVTLAPGTNELEEMTESYQVSIGDSKLLPSSEEEIETIDSWLSHFGSLDFELDGDELFGVTSRGAVADEPKQNKGSLHRSRDLSGPLESIVVFLASDDDSNEGKRDLRSKDTQDQNANQELVQTPDNLTIVDSCGNRRSPTIPNTLSASGMKDTDKRLLESPSISNAKLPSEILPPLLPKNKASSSSSRTQSHRCSFCQRPFSRLSDLKYPTLPFSRTRIRKY